MALPRLNWVTYYVAAEWLAMLDKLRLRLKMLLFLRVVSSLATLLWRQVAYTHWLSVEWGEARVGLSWCLLP
jgi:hypothetical protein